MVWTSPITFVDGSALTASQLNTMIRDNLLETAPAKSSLDAIGGYFVTEGYNQIGVRKPSLSNVYDTTDESYFIEGQFGDPIANMAKTPPESGPSVTCQTGTTAMVLISTGFLVTGGGTTPVTDPDNQRSLVVGVEVSGATTIPATEKQALVCYSLLPTAPSNTLVFRFTNVQAGHVLWFDNLNPGENTFKMVWKIGSKVGSDDGKATIRRRKMLVMPF